MLQQRDNHLVRLRPRADTVYVSQGRTVFATERDGFICDGAEHGLFVHQTRLLSRYRYLIDGTPLQSGYGNGSCIFCKGQPPFAHLTGSYYDLAA